MLADPQNQVTRIIKLSGKIIHALLIVVTLIIYFCLNYFLIRLNLLYSYPFRPLIVTINIWCSFNSVFNYVMVTLVDPGSPSQLPPHLLQGITKKCTICFQGKPPRTHHCTFCEKCVLQMDHHCVWIGNCVGHHNRKYFIHFLTYVTLQLSSLTLTLGSLGLAHQYSDDCWVWWAPSQFFIGCLPYVVNLAWRLAKPILLQIPVVNCHTIWKQSLELPTYFQRSSLPPIFYSIQAASGILGE